jgi:hypothetical protein
MEAKIHSRMQGKLSQTVVPIIIIPRQLLTVASMTVENFVKNKSPRRTVKASASHLIQNPQRKEMAGITRQVHN